MTEWIWSDPPMNDFRSVTVLCRCVGCGAQREVGAASVAAGDQPLCNECFLPMVPVKATAKKGRR